MDQQLSVSVLKHMIKAGISAVISQKDHLNAINVFPVPDGDTGTNMVATIKPLLVGIDAQYTWLDLLTYIQDTMLLASRGNSGTVLSQRFQGRCNALIASTDGDDTNNISLEQFRDACRAGYQSASDSFAHPQIGTILDVMQVLYHTPIGPDYWASLNHALATACNQTRHTMKQLRNKDIPDAGAVGFYQLIAGMCSTMMEQQEHNNLLDIHHHDESDLKESESPHHSMTYRYCTECVLQDSTRTVAEWKQDLASRGDSLQIVGGNQHIKIHIHTDHPDDVMKLCETYALIVDFKSDDMKQMVDDHAQYVQHFVSSSDQTGSAKIPLALVVDSGCDLPETLGIQIPVITISTPVVNKVDDESVTSSSHQELSALYDRMIHDPRFVPITSQPSLYACQQAIKQALQKAESVICISISSGLSGTYERMCLAAKQLGSDQIHCIDSQTASAGMASMIYQIDQLAHQQTSIVDILSHVGEAIAQSSVFACIAPASLKYLARGGRISSRSYQIGRMIMLRPILGLDHGRIISLAKIPFATDQRIIKRILGLFQHYDEQMGGPYQVILTYTDDHSHHLLKVLKALLLSRYEYTQHHLHIVQMNPVIGAHVGPGTIGMFAWKVS